MRALALALLVALLPVAGCDKGGSAKPEPPTAWDKPSDGAAGAKPSAAGSAALVNVIEGAAFWDLFPEKGMDDTTDRTFTAAKTGMTEATYKKGKDEYARLIITDTNATPAVRDDYKAASDRVSGYPLKTSGTAKSAILVADRFEVTCASARLDAAARKRWLEKVDLPSLAKMK